MAFNFLVLSMGERVWTLPEMEKIRGGLRKTERLVWNILNSRFYRDLLEEM